MWIEVIKASSKAKCRGQNCKKLPEYINRKGRIKKGTSCAMISIAGANGGSTAYYCRDCIDQVYYSVKLALNPKLWAFK